MTDHWRLRPNDSRLIKSRRFRERILRKSHCPATKITTAQASEGHKESMTGTECSRIFRFRFRLALTALHLTLEEARTSDGIDDSTKLLTMAVAVDVQESKMSRSPRRENGGVSRGLKFEISSLSDRTLLKIPARRCEQVRSTQ